MIYERRVDAALCDMPHGIRGIGDRPRKPDLFRELYLPVPPLDTEHLIEPRGFRIGNL